MQLPVVGEAHHPANTEGQWENNPLDKSTRRTRGRDHRNPQHGGNGDRSSQTTPVNRKMTETPRNKESPQRTNDSEFEERRYEVSNNQFTRIYVILEDNEAQAQNACKAGARAIKSA